jgi:DNA-binding transcriptional LysR family regulator
MDLRQLRQFVAVAEERGFRRAAERLHVSQPPLTVAVQRLESEVGVALFHRNRQGVHLTAAGEAFLHEARRTLAHAQVSIDIARRAAEGKIGTLRLSFVPSAALVLVPRLLREFRKDHPDVKLMLSGDTTAQQVSDLAQGSVDLGIVVPPLNESGEMQVRTFTAEKLVLAVPATHALASTKTVQLGALAAEAFIGFPLKEGPGFGNVVIAACQDCGFSPRFVEVAPQMQAILALVASGVGIALVPHPMAAVQMENVAYVQVRKRNAAVTYPLALAYRSSNANPALSAFIAIADRAASKKH